MSVLNDIGTFFKLSFYLKEIQMANSNQLFKVAGITTNKGEAKARFANDMIRRIKQFTKGGHERVDFIELPSEMTKIEALKYLQAHADFQSAADQATIADTLADKTKEASKGEVKVKSSKTKPSIDAIKARSKKSKEVSVAEILAAVEDAPL
jgi:hypothetical protein